MIVNDTLSLEFGPANELGRTPVTARFRGEALYADQVDLGVAQDRTRFSAAVIERCPGLEADAIEQGLLRAHHQPRKSRSRNVRRPSREPFPLDALPADVADFCRVVARARCVDESVPALAALVSMAAAIGGSREAWDSYAAWSEPCIVWGAIVLRSGGRKTPVIDDMFGPIRERQVRKSRKYEQEKAAHERGLEEWESAKKKSMRDAGPKPTPPTRVDLYTSDATPEAMARLLSVNPRGVVSILDELSGFFGRMGKYGGTGPLADMSFWLSLFRAQSAKIDRASKDQTFVARGVGSIIGGIQPKILASCFDETALSTGMASRFLLVAPKPQRKAYRQGPSEKQSARWADLIDRLYELPFEQSENELGEVAERHVRVPFDSSCRDLLEEFVPQWSEEGMAEAESIEAAMSKLEGYALRFALILRCVREARREAGPHDPITRADLELGIRLATWFKGEAAAIYSEITEDDGDAQKRKLEAWVEAIRAKGGAVTASEWHKRNKSRTREQSDAELAQLVEAGVVKWRDRPTSVKGGAPTRECALAPEVEGVVGCSPFDLGPDEDREDQGEAPADGSEVVGSGLWGLNHITETTPHPDTAKGDGGDSEPSTSLNRHPTTPPDPPISGAPSEEGVRGDVADTPQPTTHNPPTVEGDWSDAQDRPREADSDQVGESGEFIPWSELVSSTTSVPKCYSCGSAGQWRRRGGTHAASGDWRCTACSPPKTHEDLIERRNRGGVA